MKLARKILFMGLCISALACGKDDVDDITLEDAWEIMQECQAECLCDIETIKNNLIGKWELVIYQCGFCTPKDYMVDAKIEFSKDSGSVYYTKEGIDTTFTFTWTVDFLTLNQEAFYIKTEPSTSYLRMANFCSEYMFSDTRPVDGPLFLYQKQ